ncbi:transport protein [Moritella sp. JT01]|uniref:ABC transporter substrate-binding protein n=1 Tax=Moritella sp. JT01 TaxID=756698 RepID=UPI000799B4AF|nr:ABC transporter substrate-binding protein [Moritella sp. JT01]KXO12827.1 transport protein [Moritella sp. JT01]
MNLVNKKARLLHDFRNMCRLAVLFLLGLSLPCSALARESTESFTVGIILGQKNNLTSTSNNEKMCILKYVTDNYSQMGKKVNFIFVENFRTVVGTAKAALSLIESNVDLVLIPLISREAIIASRIFTEAKIPFVTTATSVSIIAKNSYGLSTMPSNQHQANLLADLYQKEYPDSKIHVVTNSSNESSKSISKIFSARILTDNPNAEIIQHSFTRQNIKGIASQIEDGEVVSAFLYNPDIAILYIALSQRDKKIHILGPDSIGARKEFFSIIGTTSDKVTLQYLKNWDHTVKGPNKKRFIPIFKTYCGEKQSTFLTAYSFDLINFVLSEMDNLKKADSPMSIIKILKNSDYVTVMDGQKFNFDKNGYNKKNMYIYHVKDSQAKLDDLLK